MSRKATYERKTLETEVKISLNLDGTGQKNISTGIRFFDHMLEQLAAHGHFDLDIKVVTHDKDTHHVVEDVAITLGEVFKQTLGDKKGIKRYGKMLLPMDESLALVAVDLSGRPYSNVDAQINEQTVSDFDTILVKHFFNSFAVASLSTIHINLMYGEDTHHKIEAIFKSFARALSEACTIDALHKDIMPSTKGIL
jgi:imidazoleglycerol-phosphate dehydratase